MLNLVEINQRYSANHVAPYPLTISHGKGVYVFDSYEKSYLDFASGISVVNFGHQHPRLLKALISQANKIAIVPRLFYNEPLTLFLEKACHLFQMDKALPMNSGAEAAEAAIKIARKWGYTVKNIPQNQAEIIVCQDSFHGRTITTLSTSSTSKYKDNFGPFTPGFKLIPFNDIKVLEQTITPNTAAFLVEPIQGEAGVIIPHEGYLEACEKVCRKHNVLFILDEIQSGMGRTGKILASHYGKVHPDGILLGKALGGGFLPISVFLANDHVMNVLHPGEHGSTFGGNPLASFVAYEALNTLVEEELPQNAMKMGHYFLEQLKQIKTPAICAIRGKGLFIAIEINPEVIPSRTIFEKLIQNGLLSIDTRSKVIRLLPPLILNKHHIDEAVDIVQQTFNNLDLC